MQNTLPFNPGPWLEAMGVKTSKTTFNNDQPRSGKEKDLWLETLFRDYS